MMGGGVCWIDIDNDGRLDLFAVNSYADGDLGYWQQHGGTPRSGLFHNVDGKFPDVSRTSGAACSSAATAASPAISTATASPTSTSPPPANDALLWNDGNGHFSGGRPRRRDHRLGLARGRRRRGRERRRPPRPLRGGLRRLERAGPGSDAGLPEQLPGRPRPPLPQRGQRRERPRALPRGRREAADRRGAPEHGLGAVFTDVNGDGRLDLYVANDANPNRLYLNLPWPGGATPIRSASASGSTRARRERRRRRPERGHGHRGRRLQRRRTPRPSRHELAQASSTASSAARRRSAASRCSPTRASDIAPAFDTSLAGWGASWVDLDNDSEPRSRARERRHPRDRPREERRARAGVREPHRARSSGRVRRREEPVGLGAAPHVNGRGLAAADYDNDGNVDIAVNTIGGKLMLLRNTGANGNWLEVSLPRSRPGAVVTAVLPDGRRLVQEIHAGQQLPLVRGSASPLRAREEEWNRAAAEADRIPANRSYARLTRATRGQSLGGSC